MFDGNPVSFDKLFPDGNRGSGPLEISSVLASPRPIPFDPEGTTRWEESVQGQPSELWLSALETLEHPIFCDLNHFKSQAWI